MADLKKPRGPLIAPSLPVLEKPATTGPTLRAAPAHRADPLGSDPLVKGADLRSDALDMAGHDGLGLGLGLAEHAARSGGHLATAGAAGGTGAVLGGISAPFSFKEGADRTGTGAAKLANGELLEGGFDVAAGGATGVSAGLTMAGLVGKGLAATTGAAATAGQAITGAVTGGTAAAGLGTSVAAAGALPVLGAAATGFAGGAALGSSGNDFVQKHGLVGKGQDGKNRSISDWVADTAADDHLAVLQATGSSGLADAAGYASYAGRSLLATPGAALAGAAGIVEAAGGLAADAWDWATGTQKPAASPATAAPAVSPAAAPAATLPGPRREYLDKKK